MVKTNFFKGTKNYLRLGFSNFIATGIYAIFWMYLAAVVEKTTYGELGFLMSIANVANAVAALGIGRMMIVYGAKNENIFSPAYALGLISSSMVSIVIYVIIQNVTVSFLIFGMMFFYLNESDLISKKRYASVSKYKLLRSTLTVIFAIILYQIFGINGIILGYALATLPTLRGFYIFIKAKKINIFSLKPKIGFLLNNWFSWLATGLFFWADKMIIGILFGFSILGSYQLAAQFFMLLNTFPLVVSSYLLPQEAEGTHNKKIKIFSIAIACILVLLSIIAAPFVVNIFFSDYGTSVVPIQIMSMAIIPFTFSSIFESQFLGKGKSKIVLIGNLLQTGSYFSLIILLGQTYGLIGISIGFLISSILRTILNLSASLHASKK